MTPDLPRFFRACNPSMTLNCGNEEDRKYYIDFSSVRGSNIIRELGRTITLLAGDDPSCQLFTGHIGCGKSTELFRLKAELEEKGFHVVYFESSKDLDMADVDITDILLAIARQVSESLEKIKVYTQPRGFSALLKGAAEILQSPIQLEGEAGIPGLGSITVGEGELGISLTGGIGKITAKTKDSPKLRSQLRQYLEPRTNTILEAINKELLIPASEQLKRIGKKGLVVIVDNLDRIDSTPKGAGRTQPEYLFVERGEQLTKLHCHVIYTIPLALIFSNELGRLTSRFGVKPKVLPMVPVRERDGRYCVKGMALLRQMVLARAFPDLSPQQRLQEIEQVFDSVETLDRLCQVSGGHVRNLLGLLYSCLQQEDPPLSRNCVENVIREYRDDLIAALADDEWELLFQALQQQSVIGDENYQILLRSMFLFEYRDENGRWFWINPALAEAEKFKSWQLQKA
ncbi:MAG: KAP family NTPase [Oscillatoriaceae bacterium SKW80]|nr:KAP family NTPase [Oscillatoriaceae bacterium SKYG93]MCX8119602.1 KAP family NTPase [Oscillatoriaceae bacterium SKW80]MDW8455069.1 AAA family ATPase [Oscillatoriaceae cyanobacterium SKYGB_i_bin93]HIK28154.1 AAA family ATPase [Oscillatoriaceae cyanobacterium M7585_C2015_266]